MVQTFSLSLSLSGDGAEIVASETSEESMPFDTAEGPRIFF
jgi:hypothetical protein